MRLMLLKCTYCLVALLLSATFLIVPDAVARMTLDGYELYEKDKVIFINNDVIDASTTINAALKYLSNRPDKTTWWTIYFAGGKYLLSHPLVADGLQHVSMASQPGNPAMLIKPTTSNYEYMLYCRYCSNFSFQGFSVYGKTASYDPAIETNTRHPNWGDQGLFFASANKIEVSNNRFFDFGNAALRVTTYSHDPVKNVNSFNSVVTNNYFQNIFQVTTTSDSYDHGGSANFFFVNNVASNLHGSIKFASRTPGATNVQIKNNTIDSSTMGGFEISSYDNVDMSYNRLTNIARYAINCYTNDRTNKGFNWGDDLRIRNNIIDGAGRGIRINPGLYSDGFRPVPRKVAITDNTISNLRGDAPAVAVFGGVIQGLDISNNKLNKIASGRYFDVQPGSTDVTITGNIVDNELYTAIQ